MMVLKRNQEAEAGTYQVKHVTKAIDEEKPTFLLDLEKTVQNETLQSGTIIVPVKGAASNLIPLLLEPESTWGIVSTRATGKYRFDSYLGEGKPYPVKRLTSIEHLDAEKLEYQAQ